MMKIYWKLLFISLLIGICIYGILFGVSNLLEFHYSYKTYSPLFGVIASIVYFTFKLEEIQNLNFRRNYEAEISKNLNISEIEFTQIFKEQKSLFIHIPFGLISLSFGIYLIVNKYIAGIAFIVIGIILLYIAFRTKVIYVKFSKEGIYTSDFGFIYFKHIETIEFYRHYGQTHSAYMKIFMKNHPLYKMKEPFLLQSISACEKRKELVNLLRNKTEKPIKNFGI